MSATITISPSEIRQIFQPRTSSASKFWELAQKANNLAVIIDARWEQIPSETRELLKIFAYALIEPPQGINPHSADIRSDLISKRFRIVKTSNDCYAII